MAVTKTLKKLFQLNIRHANSAPSNLTHLKIGFAKRHDVGHHHNKKKSFLNAEAVPSYSAPSLKVHNFFYATHSHIMNLLDLCEF